jgi:hypothetical protein
MKDALIFSKQHEPHEDLGAPENIFEDWEDEKEDIECSPSQITEEDDLEEDSLVIFHVGSIGTRYGEPTPFYVTLQINDFLLHNCVFDPDASRNIMTQRVMHQLGLSISRPYNDTRDGFTCGLIKDLVVSFHTFPDVSFKIDVIVIDTLSSWGILLCKDLVEKLGRSFQDQGSKAIIPHPREDLSPFTRNLSLDVSLKPLKNPLINSSV